MWDQKMVADQVARIVEKHLVSKARRSFPFSPSLSHTRHHLLLSPTQIVTFDEKGVSGHQNHIATHYGVRHLLATRKDLAAKVQMFSLVSHSTLRKYLGLFNLVFLWREPNVVMVASPRHTKAGREAMKKHKSQYVWFRQLYVTFSSYLFVNILKKEVV